MSGICGLWRLDGGPAGGASAIAALLERRGPDGTRLWEDGAVALGHALLATTPEALRERLPLTDPATGCTITADVRLDNRDELIAALDLGPAGRGMGDGELILRAWLAWGEGAPGRLLGDFAFAIWDPRARRLFAARDPMGMRPLVYAHRPGRLFAFATEVRAVLAAPGVPAHLDEGRIADFLEGELEGIDFTSTFFQGVLRLPPAHALTVDMGGLRLRRFWAPEPRPELRLPGDAAYAEAFREVLTEAVRCRLRSAGPVGSMLSGGMDSGAVAAVASRLLAAEGRGPLPTFSVLGPDPATCPETRAIRAALTMPNLDPHLLDWSEPGPWREEILGLLRDMDEPFDGHANLVRGVYAMAHRAGVRVVLDGVGGDIVLADGGRIMELVRRLRWREAWGEAAAERRLHPARPPAWRSLAAHLRQAATPAWARRLKRALRPLPPGRPTLGLLSPEFAARIGLAERQARDLAQEIDGWPPPSEVLAHTIGRAYLTAARERYDRIASALAVEPRDPFLDRRVIDLCLSLPPGQRRAGGWPKIVLRRAMAGLLPDEVVWRRGKEHLGFATTSAVLAAWPGWPDRLAEARPALGRYVHPALFASDGGAPGLVGSAMAEDQWEALFLALWLDRHGPTAAAADPAARTG
ncbi:Asparagine synthetase (glutamine-hydrolyzing) [Rubellimicrobium mesophilum DSM 19309]|uniref:asparagine synthase (glutamine-hydrolyzing) n=1 Tax=Rubellimicrobium mesophilum DSM 19309 TaxID=442562 RepID=A0A017HL53_9RHOB|nr:asparagine synthase-related protein [Rubellimicrobium mesophilum]EYD75056.1 Asparagine synthetase (glutamine-hydrolyzing) [Rubellimicrobium mesophilum DSM 19309]